MYVAKEGEEVLPIFDWLAFETFLEEVSHAIVLVVVVEDVGRGDALHDIANGFIGLLDE